jgi:hypothetical protein
MLHADARAGNAKSLPHGKNVAVGNVTDLIPFFCCRFITPQVDRTGLAQCAISCTFFVCISSSQTQGVEPTFARYVK